ncbi:hypothetical protein SAMN05661010_01429 [Modicisalibacter muralis]|uniref:Uncharacterized protein n=1 Tax=Modicisalibacter muralis TaxID=119000 RepID=A0A1G9JE79_9GAMM|nr:hypothetical protein SAMN05661010_01429 [Halomonas muralis]
MPGPILTSIGHGALMSTLCIVSDDAPSRGAHNRPDAVVNDRDTGMPIERSA